MLEGAREEVKRGNRGRSMFDNLPVVTTGICCLVFVGGTVVV